jgi:glycerol-3-phosphate O-acyltransferase/dihydroxyacetone phosphate acyltransferase
MYLLLKYLVKISLWFFYRKITVNGKENLVSEGPLLVAANHPNTLMDPLVISSLLSQRSGFVGKSTLVANGFVKWLFKQLHIIPIQRKVDSKPGMTPVDNSKAFEKCFEYLSKKGTILIFPEGTSIHEMKLRPLKTGTARIALEFESENQFNGKLMILPIALNYSEPAFFRSDLTINIGKPISVAAYQNLYQQDQIEAARKLTEELKERLESLIIITNHIEQEQLYKAIQNIYHLQLTKELEIKENTPEAFQISKEIANALAYFETNSPALYEEVETKITNYLRLVNTLNIQEGTIENSHSAFEKLIQKIWIPVYTFLFAPFYIAGLLTNYIPYQIPSRAARLITREPEYRASLMMLTGLLVFPLIYYGEFILFQKYISTVKWHGIVFFCMLPVLGFYALHFYAFLVWSKTKFFQLYSTKKRDEMYARLAGYRKEIVNLLNKAKISYQSRI